MPRINNPKNIKTKLLKLFVENYQLSEPSSYNLKALYRSPQLAREVQHLEHTFGPDMAKEKFMESYKQAVTEFADEKTALKVTSINESARAKRLI